MAETIFGVAGAAMHKAGRNTGNGATFASGYGLGPFSSCKQKRKSKRTLPLPLIHENFYENISRILSKNDFSFLSGFG